jgi:hypothetical protein
MDEENYPGNGDTRDISVTLAGNPAVIRTWRNANLLAFYSHCWLGNEL